MITLSGKIFPTPRSDAKVCLTWEADDSVGGSFKVAQELVMRALLREDHSASQ